MAKSNRFGIFNQSGETLVSVLIAVGISMFLNLVIMEMYRQQSLASKTSQQAFEATYFVDEVVANLKTPGACTANFPVGTNLTIDNTSNQMMTMDGSTPPAPIVMYKPGQLIGNNTLKIPSTGFMLLKATASPPANKTIPMDLFIKLESNGANLGGSVITKKIAVRVRTDASGNFKSCSAESSGSGNSIGAGGSREISSNKCIFVTGPPTSADNQMHSVTCPHNTAATLVEIIARDKYLDGSMKLKCCEFQNEPYVGSPTTIYSGSGRKKNSEHVAFCPQDQFITGIKIAVGNKFMEGDLEITCNQYAGITLDENISGNSSAEGYTTKYLDSAPHTADCGSSVLTGVSFYSTNNFDNIARVRCGTQPL